jgi:hypothetical protein
LLRSNDYLGQIKNFHQKGSGSFDQIAIDRKDNFQNRSFDGKINLIGDDHLITERVNSHVTKRAFDRKDRFTERLIESKKKNSVESAIDSKKETWSEQYF